MNTDKYFPPQDFSSKAHVKSFEEYEKIYSDSVKDPQTFWAQIAKDKNVEIIIDVLEITQTRFKGDPSRIRQILTNLFSNALKFTKAGEVALKARIEKVDDEHTWLICTVTDTGIGIAPEKLTDMFERFTQADTSTTRQYGGSGLGLAIVSRIMEWHQGSVDVVDSELGGACFVLSWPLKQ